MDVISSSGYYPIDDWENQLNRIEKVVEYYQKPFFFAEAGCMSTVGSKNVPNDWTIRGGIDLEGQADWYQAMFDACEKRSWVKGYALWSWTGWRKYESELSSTAIRSRTFCKTGRNCNQTQLFKKKIV